jgi:multidrug efflux pump subunit AcrB
VFQFRNAVKPLIVFSAIPFGVVGALVSLVMMRTPFGFMPFLGVVSLIGVIVSHVIVLFDFIEESHAKGESLRDALLDAGIVRLRPVLITVGATVFGLIPLALHGGPLWEGLLRPDRRTDFRDAHYAVAGAGALCDLRARSEDRHLG